MKRLWEVKHPYYCSDSNYYVGGAPQRIDTFGFHRDFQPFDHFEYDSWDAFEEWKDSDMDYNLVFRWDWKIADPDDYDEDEEVPQEIFSIYVMMQRKGRFVILSFPAKREEEPEIREWLKPRWEHMKLLWEPFE